MKFFYFSEFNSLLNMISEFYTFICFYVTNQHSFISISRNPFCIFCKVILVVKYSLSFCLFEVLYLSLIL